MTRFLITLKDNVELIDWTYNHSFSHGKMGIPKIKSMRMVDLT